MAAEQDGQEKTEQPTGRKLSKARDEGQVAKSREVSSAALIGGALLAFTLYGGPWFESWVESVRTGLDLTAFWQNGNGTGNLLHFWAPKVLGLVLPFFLLFVVIAVASNVAQFGFLFTTKTIQLKVSKLNPLPGFKKFVSLNGLVELAKNLAKLAIVGWISYATLRPEMVVLTRLCNVPVAAAIGYAGGLAMTLIFRIWIALLFMALLDFAYQKWNTKRELKMTKQEVKQEHKDLEGDPKIKSRIRSLQRDMAHRRMMQEVPSADVVITNPEHVAVAVRYDREGDMAPVVVAKGAGVICARIKELAREHDVPVVRNPPLARFLYKNVELEHEIPVDVYRAVAEILAYVYRIKGKVKHGGVDG